MQSTYDSEDRRFIETPMSTVRTSLPSEFGTLNSSVRPIYSINAMPQLKVAILHYWFLNPGGGEDVIEALLDLFPDADVFCLAASKHSLPASLCLEKLHCSPLNKLPFLTKLNRALLPLYSSVAGAFNFTGYDLVLSSDSPPMKDIVTMVGTTHISYCHTPGRFIWDLAPQFTQDLPWYLRPLFAEVASRSRISDYVSAQRVNHFVANSQHIRRKIAHYYNRESTVIYPPVNTDSGYIADSHRDYYLSVGRLEATKRIDILIHACNRMRRTLLIAGAGREERQLKAIAGPTIDFLGRVRNEELFELYAHCRALLFAADEDFGIVPVEAQAFGRPVIAYGHGGALETIRVGNTHKRFDTGVFFQRQDADSVVDGIHRFEASEHHFSPPDIRSHAQQFRKSEFIRRMRDLVQERCCYSSAQMGRTL